MIPVTVVAVISLAYLGLLFAVAYYADKKREAGRSVISNSYIYSLSLAVYFTSWTFYGSVGRAATTGLDFLPTYLGPTLIAFSWWFLLRKMVRVSKEQNIVSIADFISSRFGKSAFLGAVVTIFAVLGIMPYIALQLKAVAYSFDLLSGRTIPVSHGLQDILPTVPLLDTAFIAALILGLFGVLFGARHLDASERHEGLVAAIALESLVKLIAFVAVGIFVTFFIFDGFRDIFQRFLAEFPDRKHLLLLDTPQISYTTWFTLSFVSMMSVMFLPRQFHIMVIENSREDHIRAAMWRFPAYMFLITLFVIPIALGGLILNGGDAAQADYFVLQIPLQTEHRWLALLVFIGGFSASAGMVMVESVALSTMILHHLIIPVILKLRMGPENMSGLLINLKRIGIFAVIFLGYAYYRIIGESYALTNMGLISFLAATQFAPAFLGGLYWKRANRQGAVIGLLFGLVLWFYTLLVPSFVQSGWMDSRILEDGLFGIALLRPLELFGLSGFDMWSHSLFWSLLFNMGSFLAFSLLLAPSETEQEQGVQFADAMAPLQEKEQRKRISKAPSIIEFVDLMSKFIGEKQAHAAISQYLGDRSIDEKGSLSEYELPSLKRFTERTLAGSVGAAPARIIIENYLATRGSRMEDVFDIFGSVTLSRTSSREQLGVLYEAARVVASGADLQSILDNILEFLRQQFKFDLCVIRILDEDKMVLKVRSQRGMSSEHLGQSERELTMKTSIGTAFLTNSVVVVNDTDFMDNPASAQIIHKEGIKSFAHAPITVEGDPIGVLSAFSRSAKGIFTDEFVELFKSLAGQNGVAWRNAQQTARIIHAREREKELEIAKTIQLGLLPTKVPEIEGISLAGICVPASHVGGDYYDFLPKNRDTLDLVIADVSGHNVGAALLMAQTRTFIQSRAKELPNPSQILNSLNDFFYKDLTRAELFITMFYLRYYKENRELAFASAGHSLPIIRRADTKACENLDAEGLILGVKKNVEFQERTVRLHPGDILLLYTDGVTEAENHEGDFFGEERLCTILKENDELKPDEIIENILRQVRHFTGSPNFQDDVSLVVMKIE